MPATPTLRKSLRQARTHPTSPAERNSLRQACARLASPAVLLPDTVARNSLTNSSSTSPTIKAPHAKRRPRTYGKQAKEMILISDDDEDPPTVQEMVTGVFASQATRELKVVKKDCDDLIQEVARLKQERDYLFPIVAAVKEFSLCAICYDYFSRPVTLRCGHAFCAKCFHIESIAQTTRVSPTASRKVVDRALNFYYCPTCRTLARRDVPPNRIRGLRDTLALLPRD